jgi:hypothetical protein
MSRVSAGIRLRRIREAYPLTVEEAASAIGSRPSRIIRAEEGTLSRDELAGLTYSLMRAIDVMIIGDMYQNEQRKPK